MNLPLTMICSFPSPPLRSNDRGRWQARENRRKLIRKEAGVRAIALLSQNPDSHPLRGPLSVRMTWVVTTRLRRDVGASAATLKVWIDGLVDGGLIESDHWQVVAEESYRIELGDKPMVRVDIYPFEAVTPDGK
jgi:hypothetical protein